ncbi:probable G-protein coupled receptor Mth-like 1 [Mytilus californianus]|uniref:probable G-protein coupled receptor Mth-like 1 n=1 Tax=Mytilus californianus TaxID=6549 RepID=UPI00224830E3|nr:probable G-protein coupled receptor Mth-like 1 [Mytilus californianus]
MEKLKAQTHQMNGNNCHIPDLVQAFPDVKNGVLNLVLYCDCFQGVCREVICPSYYQYNKNNNSCEAIFSNMSNQIYEIYYKTIISDNTCITQSCYKQYASVVEFAIKVRIQSDLQGLIECERSTTEWYSDASVFWMHICTVHMFRVFFSMKMKPTVKQSKRVIVVYSLYAAIIPGLLVASNITYYLASDQNKQTTGYLGYGGYKCYITLTNMVLITFAIPIGILLVSNIVLFCLVIYKLENLPEVNSNNGKGRNMFIIYAKLTCLTGITWIFGFIYEWIRISALSYTFILLNASQGLFIFLSFCCNNRVRSMICFKCRGSDTHESSKQSRSTAVSPK